MQRTFYVTIAVCVGVLLSASSAAAGQNYMTVADARLALERDVRTWYTNDGATGYAVRDCGRQGRSVKCWVDLFNIPDTDLPESLLPVTSTRFRMRGRGCRAVSIRLMYFEPAEVSQRNGCSRSTP